MPGRFVSITWAVTVLVTATVSGCGRSRDPNADLLKIGAYSVVREVLDDGLLPAFVAEWKKKTGRVVTFERVV